MSCTAPQHQYQVGCDVPLKACETADLGAAFCIDALRVQLEEKEKDTTNAFKAPYPTKGQQVL